jgi:glycosyltransferase involved in cell wall biosynthesis
MRTILIAHNYNENSFAVISFSLAHYLADLGNRVIFISYRPFFTEKKIIRKEKGEIIVYSWPSEKRPTSIKDAIWFARLYFKYKPTSIIGHFVGANITIGISKILSLNSVRTFGYYHTLREQINLDNQKITVLKKNILFLRKKIFYKVFCDSVICPSQLAKEDFEKNFSSRKGLVVLNPMKDRFLAQENVEVNTIVVSYLGRLAVSKGVVELIQAFKSYKKENKSSKIILNIAGSGNKESEIKRLIENSSDIFYFGGLQYHEIDKYLQNTHFTIIPSKIDALNMVGIESMMNKVPLLISNTTGLAHYLEDGRECFKFDPNIHSMTLLFNRVENHIDDQSQMAINARGTFLEKFSLETYCKNFSKEILR